jgi:hypothetical protein
MPAILQPGSPIALHIRGLLRVKSCDPAQCGVRAPSLQHLRKRTHSRDIRLVAFRSRLKLKCLPAFLAAIDQNVLRRDRLGISSKVGGSVTS